MTIWFTSDTHFGHAKISAYSGRPFRDVAEMDQALINNWNERVKPGDTVYHLGDFAFVRDTEDAERYIDHLNGQIHFIRGNHDHKQTRKAKGFVEILDYKEIKVGEQHIVLCHYPMMVWNKHHHGSWMLHGHCHGNLKGQQNRRIIDVGVDPQKYKPVSFEEVQVMMKDREFIPVDHHGQRDDD